MFIIKEAILRNGASINAEIIDILEINSQVEIIGNKNEYAYVFVTDKDKKGYVILSSLSDRKIDNYFKNQKSLSFENKAQILKEAYKILNQSTSYSAKLDNKFYENGKTRGNGYYNIPYIENGVEFYSYDCSAFCDAIINRVFNEDMTKLGNIKIKITDEIVKPNLFVTKDFLSNSKKEPNDKEKKFLLIKDIQNEGENIKISDLEIGDFLIGIIDFENEKHNKKFIMNHIMLYIGDGCVMHASYTNGEEIFNRVLVTKLIDDFYTKISFEKRFDKEIAVVRFDNTAKR